MGMLVPAVLPTSKKDLEEKLELFARMPQVARIQIDVVDGEYASPACWPYTAPEEFAHMVKSNAELPLPRKFEYEIDLMCLDVERAVDAWIALGASRFTVHLGSVPNLPRVLERMRAKYTADARFIPELLAFGIALDMKDDFAKLALSLEQADYVQFMGIDTVGKQGQPFDPKVIDRVRIFRSRHPDVSVQVDGGVTLSHGRELVGLGVTNLIVGSGILKASDPFAVVKEFEDLKNPYGV